MGGIYSRKYIELKVCLMKNGHSKHDWGEMKNQVKVNCAAGMTAEMNEAPACHLLETVNMQRSSYKPKESLHLGSNQIPWNQKCRHMIRYVFVPFSIDSEYIICWSCSQLLAGNGPQKRIFICNTICHHANRSQHHTLDYLHLPLTDIIKPFGFI